MRDISIEYFEWMVNLVCGHDEKELTPSHYELLSILHEREFIYVLSMDENRAMDGVDLRYRFACEKGYDYRIVAYELDSRPCSVLEMMVALACRCENIMEDPELGDRVGIWFWEMIKSLGLYYSNRNAELKIDIFLNREYYPDGEGSLFTIKNCKTDLRRVEIWDQMNWYLNTVR